MKSLMSREEVVQACGAEAVDWVDSLNCEPTSRATGDGTAEFTASVPIGDGAALVAYYYQNRDVVEQLEDLSGLDWIIEGYEVI